MDGGDLVIGVHDKTLEIVGTDTYNYDKQKGNIASNRKMRKSFNRRLIYR